MLKLHSCHIESEHETKIEHNLEYQNAVKAMSAAMGAQNIDDIRHTLMEEELRLTSRCYKDNFELPMKRNFLGLYTIPVIINSQKYNFILDTGAQISGIKSDLVNKLVIPHTKGKMSVGSIGGKEKWMEGVCVQNVRIGALEFFQLPMIQLDSSDYQLPLLNISMFPFDGIIGWDILAQLDFELDDIAKQFKVMKNIHHFSYCNMVNGLFPAFLLKDDAGNLRSFGFDSGAKYSWINPNIIDKHALHVINEGIGIGFGVHGLEQLDMKMIEGCTYHLYKARIDLRNINTGRTNIYKGYEFDGILGNEIFRNRRIRLLNSCGMVLLR